MGGLLLNSVLVLLVRNFVSGFRLSGWVDVYILHRKYHVKPH